MTWFSDESVAQHVLKNSLKIKRERREWVSSYQNVVSFIIIRRKLKKLIRKKEKKNICRMVEVTSHRQLALIGSASPMTNHTPCLHLHPDRTQYRILQVSKPFFIKIGHNYSTILSRPLNSSRCLYIIIIIVNMLSLVLAWYLPPGGPPGGPPGAPPGQKAELVDHRWERNYRELLRMYMFPGAYS